MFGIGIVRLDRPPDIRNFQHVVAERMVPRISLDGHRSLRQREMLSAERRLDKQFAAGFGEFGNRDRVAEHVVHPAQSSGLRRYLDAGVEKTQIVAVPGPAHQAVGTEDDGLPVAVLGSMCDTENGQGRGVTD